MRTMPRFIPVFPLNLVAFPTENLPLHIFEPRYKQLIGECLDREGTFGIQPLIDGDLAEFGTEVRVVKVLREYDGGELDIVTQGVRAFRLMKFHEDVPEKLYSGADVRFIENDPITDPQLRDEVVDLLLELSHLLDTEMNIHDPKIKHLSFAVGHKVGLTLEQKVELLSIANETDRLGYLREHLRETIPKVRSAERILKKVGENGSLRVLREDDDSAPPT